MKFQPHGGGPTTYVTHAALSLQLGRMLTALGWAKTKVTLIIYSCRSGEAFNPGSYGTNMNGSLIITATPNSTQLSYVGTFMNCLMQCLRSSTVTTWTQLRTCMTQCMRGKSVNGRPLGTGRFGRPAR